MVSVMRQARPRQLTRPLEVTVGLGLLFFGSAKIASDSALSSGLVIAAVLELLGGVAMVLGRRTRLIAAAVVLAAMVGVVLVFVRPGRLGGCRCAGEWWSMTAGSRIAVLATLGFLSTLIAAQRSTR